jgi:hypothetical protein
MFTKYYDRALSSLSQNYDGENRDPPPPPKMYVWPRERFNLVECLFV